MASPALLDIMSAQVEAEREESLAKARAEADQIRQNATDRAAERRTQTLADLKTELETTAAQSKERAESAAAMIALTTKDTVTDELLQDVQRDLKARAADPAFADTLSALLAELMPEAPDGGTVLVPPAHEDHCRSWLEQNGPRRYERQGKSGGDRWSGGGRCESQVSCHQYAEHALRSP